MKLTSKLAHPLKTFPPSPPLKKLPKSFLMTSNRDSHGTTDIKPKKLSGVQTRNVIQHVEYNIGALRIKGSNFVCEVTRYTVNL